MDRKSGERRRPGQAASREFCVVHPDGRVSDEELHNEILNSISPEAEARVREIGKQQARRAGLSDEDIKLLYAIPDEQTESDLTAEELKAIHDAVERDIVERGVPSETDLMKEIERMNETAPSPSSSGRRP